MTASDPLNPDLVNRLKSLVLSFSPHKSFRRVASTAREVVVSRRIPVDGSIASLHALISGTGGMFDTRNVRHFVSQEDDVLKRAKQEYGQELSNFVRRKIDPKAENMPRRWPQSGVAAGCAQQRDGPKEALFAPFSESSQQSGKQNKLLSPKPPTKSEKLKFYPASGSTSSTKKQSPNKDRKVVTPLGSPVSAAKSPGGVLSSGGGKESKASLQPPRILPTESQWAAGVSIHAADHAKYWNQPGHDWETEVFVPGAAFYGKCKAFLSFGAHVNMLKYFFWYVFLWVSASRVR